MFECYISAITTVFTHSLYARIGYRVLYFMFEQRVFVQRNYSFLWLIVEPADICLCFRLDYCHVYAVTSSRFLFVCLFLDIPEPMC